MKNKKKLKIDLREHTQNIFNEDNHSEVETEKLIEFIQDINHLIICCWNQPKYNSKELMTKNYIVKEELTKVNWELHDY